MGQPRLLFVYFRSFWQQFYTKNFRLQWDSNWNRWIEGKHSDHLTTTTAKIKLLLFRLTFDIVLSIRLNHQWKGKTQVYLKWGKNGGGHHSSVDSSAPSILRSWVWIPSLQSKLFPFIIILYLSLYQENDENKQKEEGVWPIFKNAFNYLLAMDSDLWVSLVRC